MPAAPLLAPQLDDDTTIVLHVERDSISRKKTLRAELAPRLPCLGEDYRRRISERLREIRRGERCLRGHGAVRMTAEQDASGPFLLSTCTVPGCGAQQVVRMGDLT